VEVRVPMMVQDPMTARHEGIDPVEGFFISREDFFHDGPVTKRVAVLDFDPKTGELSPGVRFLPPPPGRKRGGYEIEDETNFHARDFVQVNAFATVLKTMYMFEKEDTLGRDLSWAFDGPQLLVIPRAGEWANAYYERDSHSLQLFYFNNPRDPAKTIYTSLSRDITAHETGHAILDGIAPDLYDAITPQSLALHEAVADLTASLMAFGSHTLTQTVLDMKGGSIKDSTAFSAIAEEFGTAFAADSRAGWLRNLNNNKNLNGGDPDCVAREEPHELSEVLSGALYTVILNLHEQLKEEYAGGDPEEKFTVSGKALADAAHRFQRLIFRALDYLPPGEVSFADYGRAIIAADQASHPDEERERQWVRDEFVKRGIVPDMKALEVKTDYEHPAVTEVDLQTLIESDWVAYEFAKENRDLLCIPETREGEPDLPLPFKVRPRLDVTKRYYHGDGEQKRVRECLFKVSWDHVEPNPTGSAFPDRRRITVGTTLAINWETKKVRAVLTSDHSNRPDELREQQEDRDKMLRRLLGEGLLKLGAQAVGPDGEPLRSVVSAESTHGYMRVRGAVRMLHIARRS
jgi:hypothetical protein